MFISHKSDEVEGDSNHHIKICKGFACLFCVTIVSGQVLVLCFRARVNP